MAFYNPRLAKHWQKSDEIWHAGDIGSVGVLEALEAQKPVRAVYGNIDGTDIRKCCPRDQRFNCEGMDVWITHIGGYPNKYDRLVREDIHANPPGLFICGHSHILKVMHDKKLGMLHINPGAAGNHGMHKVVTAVRFNIDAGRIKDMEVIEMDRKGR